MRMMMMTMIRRSGKRSSLRRRRRRRRRRSNTHTRLGALQEVEVLRDGFGVGDEVVRGVARERGARGGVVARPAQLGPARDVIAQVPVLHVVDHRLRAAPQPVPAGQGLTLVVHFSAQLEPCQSQENTLHTLNNPNTPLTQATQPLRAPPILYKALKLS